MPSALMALPLSVTLSLSHLLPFQPDLDSSKLAEIVVIFIAWS